MGERKINVLLVDDDEDEFVIVRDLLDEIETVISFSLSWKKHYEEAQVAINSGKFEVVLVDYRLGEKTGLDLISEIREVDKITPLILLTGQGDREIDFKAMQLGASDYLIKDKIDSQLLARSIRYALRHSRAVKEIASNEKRFRSLFERSIDAIYILDDNFRIIDANDSMKKMLGYPDWEFKNMPFRNLFKDVKEFDSFVAKMKENGQVKDIEVEVISKNHESKICALNGVEIFGDNEYSSAYQGILHDITPRKRAEKDLLMAEKLVMTGNMARSIAHEVRNPLTNLNLALEQLNDEIVNEDSQLYFDIIKRNAGRIEELITQLLKSSKPRDVNLEETDINELVKNTLDLTNDRIRLRGIELVTHLESDLEHVSVDREQIKTALLNVIINAIEAMPNEDATIKIFTAKIDGMIMISIEDNGNGMDDEVLKRLFDPFFTGKPGGTGLGLTSVQNIINGHKGRIHVESKQGSGTVFRICLNTEYQGNEID